MSVTCAAGRAIRSPGTQTPATGRPSGRFGCSGTMPGGSARFAQNGRVPEAQLGALLWTMADGIEDGLRYAENAGRISDAPVCCLDEGPRSLGIDLEFAFGILTSFSLRCIGQSSQVDFI